VLGIKIWRGLRDNILLNLHQRLSRERTHENEPSISLADLLLSTVSSRFWMLDRLHIQGSSSTQAHYAYVAAQGEIDDDDVLVVDFGHQTDCMYKV
jgi:hypothetical protein